MAQDDRINTLAQRAIIVMSQKGNRKQTAWNAHQNMLAFQKESITPRSFVLPDIFVRVGQIQQPRILGHMLMSVRWENIALKVRWSFEPPTLTHSFLDKLTHFRPMFHWCRNQVVDDLHLYLKCHSSTGVFQTFC